ncbi:MAG: prepilin peptidase [Planctomycetota bacterium]
MIEAIRIIFVFMIGACVGSFLNVVIYRVPMGRSIVCPPSHCPSCGRPIRWYDNLPILSWLLLRAQCRDCKAPISIQYPLIEAATGLMVVGLYVAYFLAEARTLELGPGSPVGRTALDFVRAWPMFVAHAGLLCALLASAAVDLKYYVVPLPVMWTAAALGAVAVIISPHPFLPSAPATASAVSAAAGAGILASLWAIHKSWLTPSFIDAPDREGPVPPPPPLRKARASDRHRKRKGKGKKGRRRRGSVGATGADGVNPRVEVLREVVFLAPAVVLAIVAWVLVTKVPSAAAWWGGWFDATAHPVVAPRLAGLGGVLFGFLIGGLWIWGTRIVATIAFGREAMGMGDVHILAGVGAVTGWVVPSLAFFLAPVSGLVIVLYFFVRRRQRELPYGPWLALGTVLAMVCYDALVRYVGPGLTVLFG